MANTYLNIDMVTLEALAVLENDLTFTKRIRRKYDDYFAKSGAKIGDTLRVRKPIRATVRTGTGYTPQDITETSVNVTLTSQKGIDVEFSTADLTLNIDEFSDRILKPHIAQLANTIDDDGLQLAIQCNMATGTPGTAITTALGYLTAGAKMKEAAAPMSDWSMVVNPEQELRLVNGQVQTLQLFNPVSEITRQYKKGIMGTAFGFEWYMDQNVYTHTVGTVTGATPLMNGTTAEGATTLVMDGWVGGTSTLAKGDVLQAGSVFAVNPLNRRSTGRLQDFLVTAAATSSAGAMTASVSVWGDAIRATGAFQNVSALPADNAAITVFGVAAASLSTISGVASPQALAFHPDFATLVSADLYLPEGVDMRARKSDRQLGFSLRYIRDYDGTTDMLISRFDTLYGWAVLRQELACRVVT